MAGRRDGREAQLGTGWAQSSRVWAKDLGHGARHLPRLLAPEQSESPEATHEVGDDEAIRPLSSQSVRDETRGQGHIEGHTDGEHVEGGVVESVDGALGTGPRGAARRESGEVTRRRPRQVRALEQQVSELVVGATSEIVGQGPDARGRCRFGHVSAVTTREGEGRPNCAAIHVDVATSDSRSMPVSTPAPSSAHTRSSVAKLPVALSA